MGGGEGERRIRWGLYRVGEPPRSKRSGLCMDMDCPPGVPRSVVMDQACLSRSQSSRCGGVYAVAIEICKELERNNGTEVFFFVNTESR